MQCSARLSDFVLWLGMRGGCKSGSLTSAEQFAPNQEINKRRARKRGWAAHPLVGLLRGGSGRGARPDGLPFAISPAAGAEARAAAQRAAVPPLQRSQWAGGACGAAGSFCRVRCRQVPLRSMQSSHRMACKSRALGDRGCGSDLHPLHSITLPEASCLNDN